MTDSYKAADAARVLECSERLVRKMASDGRLTVVARDPLRVSQESVHQQRSKRPRKQKTEQPQRITDDDLRKIAQDTATATAVQVVEQMFARMLESRDQVEQRLAAELAAERQETERLRQELAEIKAQPALRLPPIGWPFRR